jgi:hypothetical protein
MASKVVWIAGGLTGAALVAVYLLTRKTQNSAQTATSSNSTGSSTSTASLTTKGSGNDVQTYYQAGTIPPQGKEPPGLTANAWQAAPGGGYTLFVSANGGVPYLPVFPSDPTIPAPIMLALAYVIPGEYSSLNGAPQNAGMAGQAITFEVEGPAGSGSVQVTTAANGFAQFNYPGQNIGFSTTETGLVTLTTSWTDPNGNLHKLVSYVRVETYDELNGTHFK